MTDEERERIARARDGARQFGYLLTVTGALNLPAPITHMAFAGRDVVGQPASGSFLTYSTSAADAAEAGLEILRGIVERGDRPEPS